MDGTRDTGNFLPISVRTRTWTNSRLFAIKLQSSNFGYNNGPVDLIFIMLVAIGQRVLHPFNSCTFYTTVFNLSPQSLRMTEKD